MLNFDLFRPHELSKSDRADFSNCVSLHRDSLLERYIKNVLVSFDHTTHSKGKYLLPYPGKEVMQIASSKNIPALRPMVGFDSGRIQSLRSLYFRHLCDISAAANTLASRIDTNEFPRIKAVCNSVHNLAHRAILDNIRFMEKALTCHPLMLENLDYFLAGDRIDCELNFHFYTLIFTRSNVRYLEDLKALDDLTSTIVIRYRYNLDSYSIHEENFSSTHLHTGDEWVDKTKGESAS
jgi:predicted nuclease of restriction endonuclease-like (RecB) superfamily